jgi:hypothetical protein
MEPLPLGHDEQFGDYGQIDNSLRAWILQNNLQGRRATFRMEFWNMCDR